MILAPFLALSGLSPLLLHGRMFLSGQKDKAGPTRSHGHAVSRIPGFRASRPRVAAAAAPRGLCRCFHPVDTHSAARALDPKEPRTESIPWQEEEVGKQGVGQPPGQGPGCGQEELGFSTEG